MQSYSVGHKLKDQWGDLVTKRMAGYFCAFADWVVDSVVSVCSTVLEGARWAADKLWKGVKWIGSQLWKVVKSIGSILYEAMVWVYHAVRRWLIGPIRRQRRRLHRWLRRLASRDPLFH